MKTYHQFTKPILRMHMPIDGILESRIYGIKSVQYKDMCIKSDYTLSRYSDILCKLICTETKIFSSLVCYR